MGVGIAVLFSNGLIPSIFVDSNGTRTIANECLQTSDFGRLEGCFSGILKDSS